MGRARHRAPGQSFPKRRSRHETGGALHVRGPQPAVRAGLQRASLVGALALAGCISPPSPISMYEGGELSLSWGSDDAPAWPTDSGGDPTDDGTAGGTTGGAGPGSDSSAGASTASDSFGDVTGDPTGADVFPPPEMFGDDVRELDLVGTWGLPWDPNGVADVTLMIASDGNFHWRETSADCSQEATATGVLWVEGTQLVLHVDKWPKSLPWATAGVTGESYDPPFRLRLGYAPMGEFLGLAGPPTLTDVRTWVGRTYDRLAAGVGPQGDWASEAELWAVPTGEVEPKLIVRDRFTADLQPGGAATVSVDSTYWYPIGPNPQGTSDLPGGWADENPGNTAGAALVVGIRHAYDAVHMLTFEPDRSFRAGVASDCP